METTYAVQENHTEPVTLQPNLSWIRMAFLVQHRLLESVNLPVEIFAWCSGCVTKNKNLHIREYFDFQINLSKLNTIFIYVWLNDKKTIRPIYL